MIFSFLLEKNQFRLGHILNASSVTLIVGNNTIMSFVGGSFGLDSAWLYIMLIGIILMLGAFRIITVEGGLVPHPALLREMRKKPKDIEFLRDIKARWSTTQARSYYELHKLNGVEQGSAIRWAGISDLEELDMPTMYELIPSMVEKRISPEDFKSIWESGVHDYTLAANFAEYGVDPAAAKALIEGATA